jgi:hypothetical protein
MEPELRSAVEPAPLAAPAAETAHMSQHAQPAADEARDLGWIFIGPHGLRAGWSIALFASFYYLFRMVIGTLFLAAGLVHEKATDSAPAVLMGELVPFFALIGAASIMALIEERRILSYNLAGTRRMLHFAFGLIAGFAALSSLVGALAWAGWLRLGVTALSVAPALRLAVLWAAAFLIVGSVEEGLFRCFALSILTRGLNFWWALAAQAAFCLYLATVGGHGAWGVYIAAVIGFFPCLMLHQRTAARSASGFWQAAWVTSTFFGLYHTSNSGENWIGILAAASIGFVFCVSVRLTGSAWWAIGCHAAWDWAETFFYGTADSGLKGQGHFLSANPGGNPLWSGGADGPEGSLLVLVAVLLLLLLLLAFYGQKHKSELFTQPQ